MKLSPIDIFNAFAGMVGLRLEPTPDYDVIERDSDKEIRRYKPLLIAETRSAGAMKPAGEKSFPVLAEYIFGRNGRGEKIGMTTPVLMKKQDSGWAMQFIMPERYARETLPPPQNGDISFSQTGARRVAALRFSGTPTEAVIREKQAELSGWLAGKGLTSDGQPYHAQYDQPFAVPFLKRNEALIDLAD